MAPNAATITLAEPESATATELAPLFQIILFDDDEHSYQYVIEMLTSIFGMSEQQAFSIAYEVDYIGQSVVKTCGLEEAIVGRDRILSYGPDPSIDSSSGSMHAVVQEVAE